MTRIQLRLYTDPGQAEAFIKIKHNDGQYHTLAAVVDTGAAVSLLPERLRTDFEHRLSGVGSVTIGQSGIAQHAFQVTEAFVTLFLEDPTGKRTPDFEARIWFANTDVVLIGFADILDRAILHLDMVRRDGWIEIDL